MIETGKLLQQRYRIDKQIGQGGMGAVYIARDERFGSVVAIKETLLMDDSYRRAIEREGRLLNSLKHPALPRVSDHFLEENGQFLVMEYIPGDDLGCMLERDQKAFPVADVLTWAGQLLDALDYLHNQAVPVIHRDIKPQNLKLTARGQIILLDFGLAKGHPTDAAPHTAAKSIFGYSKNYASLEQIQGTGTDPRSDIYSLAATLYHLFTGVPPEDALTRAMNVLNHKADPLIPAHLVNSEVPKGVSAILQRSMDLNSEMRPASAFEMRELLSQHEKYADWDVEGSYARVPVAGDLFTQRTKLMNAATRHDDDRSTDVKTAVLSPVAADHTVVTGNQAAAKPARRRFPIVAAFGSLALACTAAVGAYIYDPALFGAAEPEVQKEAILQPAAPPEPSPELRVAPADVNSSIVSESAVDEARTVSSASNPAAVSKAAKPNRPGAPRATQNGDNDPDIDIDDDDETLFVGNTMIRKGTIQTPEVYIDENGIRRRIPSPVIPAFPRLTREQLRLLSEAERKKFRVTQQKPPNPLPAPSP